MVVCYKSLFGYNGPVPFPRTYGTFSFYFKREKNALFIVETVAERKGPVFTKQTLRRGDFILLFSFLSSKVLYLFRLICLGKNEESDGTCWWWMGRFGGVSQSVCSASWVKKML